MLQILHHSLLTNQSWGIDWMLDVSNRYSISFSFSQSFEHEKAAHMSTCSSMSTLQPSFLKPELRAHAFSRSLLNNRQSSSSPLRRRYFSFDQGNVTETAIILFDLSERSVWSSQSFASFPYNCSMFETEPNRVLTGAMSGWLLAEIIRWVPCVIYRRVHRQLLCIWCIGIDNLNELAQHHRMVEIRQSSQWETMNNWDSCKGWPYGIDNIPPQRTAPS